jgi:hypothetical protein
MYYHGPYTKCNLLLLAIGGIECILFIMWFAPGICLHMGGTESSEVVNQIRVESMFININI